MYLRMSNKQKEYIEQLSEKLNKPVPFWYEGYSMAEAKKVINRLKKELLENRKKLEAARQQTLL